ncbi:MAG: hypothetical protein AB1631_23540, partial [Acidobacteriota bacterium]
QLKISWKVLLIPSDLTKDELVSLAQDIHSRRQRTYFELYDSESEIHAYLAWQEKSLERPFPAEYVKKHRVGVIGEIISSKASGWYLYRTGSDIKSLQFGHKSISGVPEENLIAPLR